LSVRRPCPGGARKKAIEDAKAKGDEHAEAR
jgi:hypothetical protein